MVLKSFARLVRDSHPTFSLFGRLLISACVYFWCATAAYCTPPAPPVITPTTGVYANVSTTVTITAAGGTTIRYTTSGVDPTISTGTVYSSAFTMPAYPYVIVKAIAISGVDVSTVASSYIYLNPDAMNIPRTDLKLWLMPGYGMLTTSNALSKWIDFSNSTNDCVQSNSSNRPGLQANALNGYYSATFNGTSSYLDMTTGLANLTTGCTIFAVCKPQSTGAGTIAVSGNTGPSNMVSFETNNTQSKIQAYNGTTASSLTSASSSLVVGNYQLLEAVHNGSGTGTLYVNGVNVNATTYSRSLSAGATETVTLGTSTGLTQASFNNTNALTKLFSGGAARFEGSTNKAVKSASIATSVLTSKKTETLYSSSTASANTTAPTVTLTNGINTNGTQTVTVGGTVTAGNVVYVTTTNSALPGGSKTDSYTVATGNTINNIATNLASAISSDTDLQKIGVSASAASAVITITSAATTFSSSLSGGATETVTYGTNVNGNVAVSLGGKATTGDTVSLIVTNSALSGGSETIGYTVASGNTLADVAAGLVSAWNSNTELQSLGLTASNSAAAQLAWSQSFSGNGQLAAGMNTAAISAVDGGSNTKTNLMQVSANAPSTVSLTFDANGNMTSDGVNSFSWDAEDRLIKVTYPGSNNFSSFVYDPLSRNVKIVETVSGSVTSTRQFILSGNDKREERDATGNLTRKVFEAGEVISGSGYFYTGDHIGSIREMTDGSGVIQAQYSFDPYGQTSKNQGSLDSDTLFAGYYSHLRSGLLCTHSRAYNPNLARFISRDSIEETGGTNLYDYVSNAPISRRDPMGTAWYSLSEFAKKIKADPSALTNGCRDVVNHFVELPSGGFPEYARMTICWLGQEEALVSAQKRSCNGCGDPVVWGKQGFGIGMTGAPTGGFDPTKFDPFFHGGGLGAAYNYIAYVPVLPSGEKGGFVGMEWGTGNGKVPPRGYININESHPTVPRWNGKLMNTEMWCSSCVKKQ